MYLLNLLESKNCATALAGHRAAILFKLDLPELKELVSLLRRSSNNLNQLTRKVHETGRVYDADLEDISQRQGQRGILQTSEAVKRGIPKSVFYNYVKEKELEQAAHGVYITPAVDGNLGK